MNEAQLMWYYENTLKDEQEQFELLRDVAEHNALFWNPEAVEQVRENRKNSFVTPDEDFDQMLEETFGRRVSISEDQKQEIDVIKMLKEERESSKFDKYIDMDLDEVNFTPFK